MTLPTDDVPEISVVVPAFNSARYIGKQLEALTTQESSPPYEIIVVDNRSDDDLATVLDSWRERFPQIRSVAAPELQGVGYARNVGAAAARAPRLMFCDADDVVSAWWLSHGRRCFEHTDLWNGSAIPVMAEDFDTTVESLRGAIGDSPAWQDPGNPLPGRFPILLGGNFGVTRAAYLELGGFDLSLGSSAEDNDLGFRARAAGHPILNSPVVRIAYRTRSDLRARRRFVYRKALGRALTATRYGAWSDPGAPHWAGAGLRAVLAGAAMLVRSTGRDWAALGERMAAVAGGLVGTVNYRWLRRIPPSQLGLGLSDIGVEDGCP